MKPCAAGRFSFLDIAPADRLLAYVRPGAAARDDILVLLNWSDAPLQATLPATATRGDLVDLLTGEKLPPSGSLALPPYGLRILGQPDGGAYDAARRSAAASSAGR